MPELMLKPKWPNTFRRTVSPAKGKPRVLTFLPAVPVEVTATEMKLLAADIGVSIFEVERDEKNRPRFVESEAIATEPDPTTTKPEMELVGGASVAHV